MSIPDLDKYLAIDCEMVSVVKAVELAKIGIVDHTGRKVYESLSFVHPDRITDYNTSTSGINSGDLEDAPKFDVVQKQVKEIIKDKILVGHALFNDLAAIQVRHLYEDVRDTSLYYPLRQLPGVNVIHEGQYPSLKTLSRELLGLTDGEFQKKQHCPVEDARMTMRIFLSVREEYENSLLKGEQVIAAIPQRYGKWYW